VTHFLAVAGGTFTVSQGRSYEYSTAQGAAAFPTETELRSEVAWRPEEAARSEESTSATRCSQCEQQRLHTMSE